MSKGLEALERNRNFIERYFVKKVEETGVYHKDMKDTMFNDLSAIEKELKALEIIIKKDITPSWFVNNLKKGMAYEDYHYSNSGSSYDMTQEEFELLKEVLL